MDWGEVTDALEEMSLVYVVVFVLFIFVAIFSIMNVVTGIFVDVAMQISQQDRDSLIAEEMARTVKQTREFHNVLEESDVDGSGTISEQEFEQYSQEDRVQAYFSALDLDITHVKEL